MIKKITYEDVLIMMAIAMLPALPILLCIGSFWLMSGIFNVLGYDNDKYQGNIRVVEMTLDLARRYPNGAFPKNDAVSQDLEKWASISYMMNDEKECWPFLQNIMLENSNSYVITAYENGDVDNFRDVDDSIVQVDFPNGSQVRVVFYQGTLVGCDMIQD